jgi:hypothetical protein
MSAACIFQLESMSPICPPWQQNGNKIIKNRVGLANKSFDIAQVKQFG